MPVADSDSLFSRLRSAKRLPSPPGTALRVLALCRRDDTDIHEIADVVMSDPALSGRLLRYANSSFAGVGRKVTSVRDSVLLLGIRTVKMTALGFSLATTDLQPRCPGFPLRRFWSESFATAVIARRLAAEMFTVDREEAFTCGLLAGVGRLAFAHGLPEEYGEVLHAASDGRPLLEVERELLGVDHAEFGAQLLDEWGLPDVLVESVRRQAQPPQSYPDGSQRARLGEVLYAALQLMPLFVCGDETAPDVRERARRFVEHVLKLDEVSWQRIAEGILADHRQVANLFDVELDSPVAVFDLYAEAQEEATRVGMVAQLERTRALEENKVLLRRATTDPLTGVANRAKFDERIEEAVAGVRRGHGHFAVIMFDIDYFKRINDAYGHDAGDQVLKEVARTVQSTLREVDLLARYGGEEFVILAPHTDQRGACTVAARIRKCVEDLRVMADGQVLRVTISVGLALTTDYAKAPLAATVMGDADQELYRSKRSGRNTWSYRGLSASQFAKARPPAGAQTAVARG